MTQPLAGYRVLDLTWQGPGPYCALVLAQLGADVIVVDDGSARGRTARDEGSLATFMGRIGSYARRECRRIALDLKHPDGQEVVGCLLERADVVLEGFRPGVAERLGLGPATLTARYPRLVYCSISGFGQDGPYRERAGHDINYLALAGLLGVTGATGGPPALPGTIVADLAAGGLPAAVAVLAALLERERTGHGQVIDVAMQEGVAALLGPLLALRAAGEPMAPAGTILTGAAPWYAVYPTADDRYLSVGAIEPWLFAHLCTRLGHPEWAELQFDRAQWPRLRADLQTLFASRPLAGWQPLFDDPNTCVAPIATIDEALFDPQLVARGVYAHGPQQAVHPRVVPRMAGVPSPPQVRAWWPEPGADAGQILSELGYDPQQQSLMRAGGGVASL